MDLYFGWSLPVLILFTLGSLALFVWVAFWIYGDADDHGQNGCLWLLLWVMFGWWALIVYLFIRGPAGRDTSVPTLDEFYKEDRSQFDRFGRGAQSGAVREKVREPEPVPDAPEFTDHHVEELIEERSYDEAEKYLREMIAIARDEGDEKRIDTYRYYYDHLKKSEKESPAPPRD